MNQVEAYDVDVPLCAAKDSDLLSHNRKWVLDCIWKKIQNQFALPSINRPCLVFKNSNLPIVDHTDSGYSSVQRMSWLQPRIQNRYD